MNTIYLDDDIKSTINSVTNLQEEDIYKEYGTI